MNEAFLREENLQEKKTFSLKGRNKK